MNKLTTDWPDFLDFYQIRFYMIGIFAGILLACLMPMAETGSVAIKLILPLLLFVTFLQVPIDSVVNGLKSGKFISALLVGNFLFVPVLVMILAWICMKIWIWTIADISEVSYLMFIIPAVFVLLSPCVDYVVSFCKMAKGDAARLTAALPLLLICQYCLFFILFATSISGGHSPGGGYAKLSNFVVEFVSIIVLPLLLAWSLQGLSKRRKRIRRATQFFKNSVVPITAFTLMVVMAYAFSEILSELGIHHYFYDFAQQNQLNEPWQSGEKYLTEEDLQSLAYDRGSPVIHIQLLYVASLYIAYACLAPFLGLFTAKLFRLKREQKIAVIFSLSTRNSLVILPVMLLFVGANEAGLATAVILTQTCVELIAQMFYVRIVPRWIKSESPS